jgi:D-lactate dehydrogenase
MKILVYNAHRFEKTFLEAAAAGQHELDYVVYPLDEHTAKDSKGFEAIMIFTSCNASAKVLDLLQANGVRFIALRCTGHDNIDLISAKKLGIKVANVPSYSPYAIAEHAVALLMALNRKIVLGQQLMKKNDFSLDELIGFDLHGKTVGIVGTGRIGSAFAHIMKGFGCHLLAYDLAENKDLVAQTGIQYVSLEEVCRQSDVISIHCPLTNENKNVFDQRLFSVMKKGVFFINTARGSLVNTKDLAEALANGIIGGAGLDVYEKERDIFFRNHLNTVIVDDLFHKLRSFSNVLITGHQAFLTKEALTNIAETTLHTMDSWQKTGKADYDLG